MYLSPTYTSCSGQEDSKNINLSINATQADRSTLVGAANWTGKTIFEHPMRRQIFANTLRRICELNLTLRLNKHIWVWYEYEYEYQWFYCKFLWELHSTKMAHVDCRKVMELLLLYDALKLLALPKRGGWWLDTSMIRFPVKFFLSQKVAKFAKIFPNMYSQSCRQNFWLPKKATPIFIASSSCNSYLYQFMTSEI